MKKGLQIKTCCDTDLKRECTCTFFTRKREGGEERKKEGGREREIERPRRRWKGREKCISKVNGRCCLYFFVLENWESKKMKQVLRDHA